MNEQTNQNNVTTDIYSDGWVKALGQWHDYGEENETVCGKPMLGNNYKNLISDRHRTVCPDCWDTKR